MGKMVHFCRVCPTANLREFLRFWGYGLRFGRTIVRFYDCRACQVQWPSVHRKRVCVVQDSPRNGLTWVKIMACHCILCISHIRDGKLHRSKDVYKSMVTPPIFCDTVQLSDSRIKNIILPWPAVWKGCNLCLLANGLLPPYCGGHHS